MLPARIVAFPIISKTDLYNIPVVSTDANLAWLKLKGVGNLTNAKEVEGFDWSTYNRYNSCNTVDKDGIKLCNLYERFLCIHSFPYVFKMPATLKPSRKYD